MELKIIDHRISQEHIAYAKPGDVGIDLRACSLIESGHKLGEAMPHVQLYPGAVVKIGTGIALNQSDTWCCIVARSGLGAKRVRPANAFGVVDTGYQGQIIVALENAGDEVVQINALDRIAQMIFLNPVRPGFQVVSEFSRETERGEGGFGHTGRD